MAAFTIRLSNLPLGLMADELKVMMRPFRFSRLRVLRDGVAFVDFTYREDAERAIVAMDGRREEYLVLRAEWVHRSDAAPQHQQQGQHTGAAVMGKQEQQQGQQEQEQGQGKEQVGMTKPQHATWATQVVAAATPVLQVAMVPQLADDASTPIPATQMRFVAAKGQGTKDRVQQLNPHRHHQQAFAGQARRQSGWVGSSGRSQRGQARVSTSNNAQVSTARPTLEQLRELKSKALTRLGLAAPGQALREEQRQVGLVGRRMAASSYAGSVGGDGASVSALSMC